MEEVIFKLIVPKNDGYEAVISGPIGYMSENYAAVDQDHGIALGRYRVTRYVSMPQDQDLLVAYGSAVMIAQHENTGASFIICSTIRDAYDHSPTAEPGIRLPMVTFDSIALSVMSPDTVIMEVSEESLGMFKRMGRQKFNRNNMPQVNRRNWSRHFDGDYYDDDWDLTDILMYYVIWDMILDDGVEAAEAAGLEVPDAFAEYEPEVAHMDAIETEGEVLEEMPEELPEIPSDETEPPVVADLDEEILEMPEELPEPESADETVSDNDVSY